jgi:di/tricarboxylate transporter
MPLAFASILGGTCTVIGTSTNVAVSGYVKRLGLEPIALFEITPLGLAIVTVGLAYMMLLGRRLLPDRAEVEVADRYELRSYLSEVAVLEGSPLVGQRIFESDLARRGMRVLAVQRRGGDTHVPDSHTAVEAGDTLQVEANPKELLKIKGESGLEIKPELKLGDIEHPVADLAVVEMMVPPRSDLTGRTLREAAFRQRYGLTALAIFREGQSLLEKLSNVRLHVGDLLLVQGPADRLAGMRRHPDLWTLEELSPSLYRPRRGALTVAFFLGALALGGLGIAPLSIALLGAAILAVLVRATTVEESYEFIDWRLVILIAAMMAFGTAMEKSGAARFLADLVLKVAAPGGAVAVLGAFAALTVLLTQPMSNAAAALVVLPVATEAARSLGADPRSFAIGIMLAASVSFLTPFEPSCILVYGPGKYRFRDFLKVGAPLTVILLALVVALVPVFWPLSAR